MTIEIVPISQQPTLIPHIAQWLWAEWGRPKGRTLAMVTERLASRAASGGPGQTFVVLTGGYASFVASDLAARPDLTPWLASVFVEGPHRGRGHAARLVRQVEEAARAASTETLWLYTGNAQELYAKLRWEVVGPELDHGAPVTLMRRQLGWITK